jgi:D-galacturonate reductase
VHGALSPSDKRFGVVALVLMDLRRRGVVGRLALCGRQGTKMPALRAHLQSIASAYRGLDATMATYPPDHVALDDDACAAPQAPARSLCVPYGCGGGGGWRVAADRAAIDACAPGDAVTIFTPDDTHFGIALYAMERGLHVLVTKPAVKTLAHHRALLQAARRSAALGRGP